MADELNLEAERAAAAKFEADQADFEAWAKSHGGLPLDLAGGNFHTDDGLALPTYKFGRTEIAWRAWANKSVRRAAPAAAQLDADLPPPNVYAHNDHIMGNSTAYSRTKVEQIVAQYAERIRLLTEERDEVRKAGFDEGWNAARRAPRPPGPARAQQQSIDTPDFVRVFGAVLTADRQRVKRGPVADPEFLAAYGALIAYIDGRTASTAAPEDAKDAAQWRETLRCVMEEMSSRFTRGDGNAPGHGHSKPGIWDGDNGVLAGKECAWCKVWNSAVNALAAAPSPLSGTEEAI